MDLTISGEARERLLALRASMDERVIPSEGIYEQQRGELFAQGAPNHVPQALDDFIAGARSKDLWNLFLPSVSGLTNVDCAVLAEETGRSPFIGPAPINCLSPDSGDIKLLHLFGTEDQKRRWLEPLLDGSIRSGFSITEQDVASSDATNISTTITADGDSYVLTGRKWWTTGAADPRCQLLIVMGRSNPEAPRHQQQSMVLVPIESPGVTVERVLPVYGFVEQQGHCEISYDVRVPTENLLGAEGEGFAVAQTRLGPGRIHQCVRAIGMAKRALELACRRVLSRTALATRSPIKASSARKWPSRAWRSIKCGCSS